MVYDLIIIGSGRSGGGDLCGACKAVVSRAGKDALKRRSDFEYV